MPDSVVPAYAYSSTLLATASRSCSHIHITPYGPSPCPVSWTGPVTSVRHVYTKLLFRLGHGHPLWEPEPTEAGEVLLGDVGYILDGGFYRLFNATLPDDHDIHKQSGVPEGYQPFTFPDTLLRRRPNALEAGPVCSKTVVAVQAEGSLCVDYPSLFIEFHLTIYGTAAAWVLPAHVHAGPYASSALKNKVQFSC